MVHSPGLVSLNNFSKCVCLSVSLSGEKARISTLGTRVRSEYGVVERLEKMSSDLATTESVLKTLMEICDEEQDTSHYCPFI